MKKVGEDIDNWSISSGVMGWIGPGVMVGFGKSVEISSSAREDAQPAHIKVMGQYWKHDLTFSKRTCTSGS